MGYIPDSVWNTYKNIINEFSDDVNKDTLTWLRYVDVPNRYGEDGDSTPDQISLNCLISYNIFRTWPLNDESLTGLSDKESMVAILNIEYLRGLGYLNSDGLFDFDPGKDIFIHKGLQYMSAAETPVAQAKDEPLLFYMVLKREETTTGTKKY